MRLGTIVPTVSPRRRPDRVQALWICSYPCRTGEIVDFADDVALTAKPGGEIGFDRDEDRLRSLKRATNKRQPPGTDTRTTLGAHAALDASRRRAFALRRMERPAGQIREDRVRDRRAAVRAVAEGGEDLAAYAAPHGGDVAYAAACRSVTGVRFSRHVGQGAARHLRPSSSGLHARGRNRDYVEGSQAERIGGRNGG